MKFAEVRDGLTEIVEKYKDLPRGSFKDAKVLYRGLLAEHKINVWEARTGISVCSDVMLTHIDSQAPIWHYLEQCDEMDEEDKKGNLLHGSRFALLGLAGYAISHPVRFVKYLKTYPEGWFPPEYMMEQHYAQKNAEK